MVLESLMCKALQGTLTLSDKAQLNEESYALYGEGCFSAMQLLVWFSQRVAHWVGRKFTSTL